MGKLRVIACGPAISIQDRGRFGLQRFGVSPAGAMDTVALAAANLLVGNPADAAAIELGLGTARFVPEVETLVALAGPDCELLVEGRAVAPLASTKVGAGETITARVGAGAVYGYLAVRGGIAEPAEMGSRSQHRRSAIGGAALGRDSLIALGETAGGSPQRLSESPFDEPDEPIRIVPGPQDDYFDAAALKQLCDQGYSIGAMRDRMGLRLEGPPLVHRDGYNVVSDGIVEGAIQVPGNGQPIVLLRDRQTTGGYPKIATIISADLRRLAQIPAGRPIRFVPVTVEEAITAASLLRAKLDGLPALLAPTQPELSSERLLGLNLIDGVVSAHANFA